MSSDTQLDDEAKQDNNEDKASNEQLNEEKKDNLGKNKGRRGDARMHRAVGAKIADPSLSLFEALIKGGFSFPPEAERTGISDSSLVDSDNVLLSQRKNQLSRRIRNERKKQHNHAMVNMLKDNHIPASAITNSHHQVTQPTTGALQEYMYRSSVGHATDSNPFLANELLQMALHNNQQHSLPSAHYVQSAAASNHLSLRQFAPLSGGFVNNGTANTNAAGNHQFSNMEGAEGAFFNMQTSQQPFSSYNGATNTRNLSQDASLHQHQMHPYFWGGSGGLQNVHDRGHGFNSNVGTQHQAGMMNNATLDTGGAIGFNELLRRKNIQQTGRGGRRGVVLPPTQTQPNQHRGQDDNQQNTTSFNPVNGNSVKIEHTDDGNGETMQLRNKGDTDNSPMMEVVTDTVNDTTTNSFTALKADESVNGHQISTSIDDDDSMTVSAKISDNENQEVGGEEDENQGTDGVSTSTNHDAKLTLASQLYQKRRSMLLKKCLIGAGFDPNEVDARLIGHLDEMIEES